MSERLGPPRINARRRQGRCYELAGRGMLECPDGTPWRLVHGTAKVFRGAWLIGGHAWCENIQSGEVYDAVANRYYLRDNYYRIWKAKPMRRFTKKQLAKTVSRQKHWGPFK